MQIMAGTIECPLAPEEVKRLEEEAGRLYDAFLQDPTGSGRDGILNVGRESMEEFQRRRNFDTPASARELWISLHSSFHVLRGIMKRLEEPKDDDFETMMAGEIEDDVTKHLNGLLFADRQIASIYTMVTNTFRR